MTTDATPHPAAAEALAALAAVERALTALDTAATFGRPGPESLARANGAMLALCGFDRYTGPAGDYPQWAT
ncbi:MAG TPA: hypothetical protein VM597_19970, partial [Gemmataceae bacterium]|nr:hypothetical protein [Gemmataceae bacterium]